MPEPVLALGGAALAEHLLAWRAVTERPDLADRHDDHGYPDPVALFALTILRTATEPDDARLRDLVRTVTDAFTDPDALPWPWNDQVPDALSSGHAKTWQHLVSTVLGPWRTARPDIDRLAAAVSGD